MSSNSHAIIINSAPFSQTKGQEALELALVLATFEEKVAIFFSGQGVLQLLSDVDGDSINEKNYPQGFKALDLYDIEEVYVLAEDLASFNLTQSELAINVKLISAPDWLPTLAKFSVQLTF
ncbi:sulfurtransferase complex subunit TusC [Gayadomonas joobiniege]|uniref:sulfurtransferase complex subunit TusC n=1 Tax=Gayadomonas joobiniege TaxID=1234606 RepID=UPI00036AE407|nr:sulfurtransferase complex subunit TusC [Gayadomonas joobiniege]